MTEQDSRPIGWDFIIAEYIPRALGNFTDLPFIYIPPVPLPEGHPDIDTWDADLRAITHAGREIWSQALHHRPKPVMPEDDLLCDFIPGCDAELDLTAAVDEFAKIADDIAEWVA